MYKCLSVIAGSVSAVGAPVVPPSMQPYRHINPRVSFDSVINFIMQRLKSIEVLSNEILFFQEDGRFSLNLQEDWLTNELTIGVRYQADIPPGTIQSWMAQSLIASESQLGSILQRRILGADRRQIDSNQILGVRSNRQLLLFTIKIDAEFIRPNEPLVISNLIDRENRIEPSGVVLFVSNKMS